MLPFRVSKIRQILSRSQDLTLSYTQTQANDLILFSLNFDKLRIANFGVICPNNKNIFPLGVERSERFSQTIGMATNSSQLLKVQLLYDEDSIPILKDDPNLKLLAVLPHAFFSQRIVEDRVSNPHGEHAEDFWSVDIEAHSPFASETSFTMLVANSLHSTITFLPTNLSSIVVTAKIVESGI